MIKEFQNFALPKYKDDYYIRKIVVVGYLEKKQALSQLENKIQELSSLKQPFGLAKALNTNSYKIYLERLQELDELKRQKKELEQEIEDMKIIYDQVYTDYLELEKQIEDTNNLDNAETFKKQFPLIVDTLKRGNIPVIITEEEQDYADAIRETTDKELKTMDDIMLVHKTSRPISYDQVVSPYNSKDFKVIPYTINGKSYLSDIRSYIHSTHFAANSSKDSFMEKDKQVYAVITNIKNIPKERIHSNLHDDFYIAENLALTEDAIILCPKSEYNTFVEKNKKALVVGYEGSLEDSIRTILTFLNYPIIDLESKKTVEVSNGKNYYDILKENNYTKVEKYEDSRLKKAEDFQKILNRILGMIEMVKSEPDLWEISPSAIIHDTSFFEDIEYILGFPEFDFADKLLELGIEVRLEELDENGYIDEEYAKTIIKKAQNLSKEDTNKKIK